MIYASTNGTPALLRPGSGAQVYAASLLNGASVACHVASAHPRSSLLLVCAGSAGRFNLEDSYGAGHIAAHLLGQRRYVCKSVTATRLLRHVLHA